MILKISSKHLGCDRFSLRYIIFWRPYNSTKKTEYKRSWL